MRSLRSLCLLKVHSLRLPALDPSLIPPNLAKDIKIMGLFNKSFIDRDQYYELGGSFVYQDALSIQYDGASWNILYRSNEFFADCCPHCDFVEPDLKQFTLEEGKLAPVLPHFTSVQRYKELMMSLNYTMEDDGTSGKIKLQLFRNSDPLPLVTRNITIGMNADRQWEASCEGFDFLQILRSRYIETPDSIQDVFSAPLYHSCIRRAMMLLQWDQYELVVGLDDVMAAVDEAFNQQEPEEFLEDFWRLIVE
eukprot:GFUD01064674.1.p1 GENE.GFUD01064674.1~~GFUD01064674.1.p1  ORF type:complete len:251 (+),score=34.14 GFUD01064674.1:51-803(+)